MGRISAERNWSRGYFHTKSKETNPAKLKISDISAVGIIAPRRRLWFFDLDWESGSMPPPPSLFSVQSRHHSLTSSISAQLRKRVSSSAGNKLTSVDGGGFVKSSFLPNYFHIKYVRHPRHLAGSQASDAAWALFAASFRFVRVSNAWAGCAHRRHSPTNTWRTDPLLLKPPGYAISPFSPSVGSTLRISLRG